MDKKIAILIVGLVGVLLLAQAYSMKTKQVELRDMYYVHEIGKDGVPLHVGEVVKVRGIVVAPPGIFYKAIYIYDPSVGRGVQVFGADLTGIVNIGDYVEVTGKISQYKGETEIVISSTTNVTVISSGHNFKAERIYTDNAYDEVYEGSFVEVCGRVESVSTSYFYLNDSSGRIQIYAPNLNIGWVQVGMNLSVTGIVAQYDTSLPYFSYYEIKPRFQSDIKNVSAISIKVSMSPSVPAANERAIISANITSPVTEVYLNYTTDNWENFTRIAMTYNSSTSEWEAEIPGEPEGTLVRYVVEAKDNSGLWNSSIERKYYVGSVGIDIGRKAPQYTRLRIYGNVTAKPGDFSPTNMYIQNSSYGIKVISGSLPALNYGDYVEVVGYVKHSRTNDVYVVAIYTINESSGNPVQPIPMSVAEANTTNYGALVEVEGTIVAMDSYGFNISDGQGNVLRIYNASHSQIPWLSVGKKVKVVGIQSQYYETHEVMIRSASDVTEVVIEINPIVLFSLVAAIIGGMRLYAEK